MLLVYGEVEDPNSPEEFTGNWNECNQKCLSEVDCVLTRHTDTLCQIFRYGNVKSVKKSENSNVVIGFKRTLICSPGMADPPLDGAESVTEACKIKTIAYNYIITKSGSHYTFNFDYFIQCQDDSFVVLRGSNVVCVSVRVFPDDSQCQNQTEALSLCSEDRGQGLSGPYSEEEGLLITEYMTEAVEKYPTNIPRTYYDFWIDGYKNEAGKYDLTDDTLNGTTGYKWSGKTINSDWRCVYLVLISGEQFVYGKNCDVTLSVTSSYCMRGAICKTMPIWNWF